MSSSRERRILDTFMSLADTLVGDYDVVDLAQVLVEHSAALFGDVPVGLVIIDESGAADVLAVTHDDARLIELLQLRTGKGPCVECARTGLPVEVPDVRALDGGWATFRTGAEALGIRAVSTMPMRLRDTTIGSLTVFRPEPGGAASEDLAVLQAFAHAATIGILHRRALNRNEAVHSQLRHALDSRVTIEQAKGAIAYANDVSVDEAFERLRSHSRRTSTPLTEIARLVLADQLEL